MIPSIALSAGPTSPHRAVLASDAITGVGHMLSTPFIQHALLAGTSIAVLSGLVGYFVVLRGQVFASDALSHVAYAGSLAALAAGVDLRFGLFAACIAIGLILGLLGGRGAADDVVIGTTFAWILGLGVFFLALYTTHSATGNSAANVTVLFGSIFGISAADARTATWIALASIAVLLLIARPLLFASLDAAVAAARGVPVRLLGPLFLAIVGITAAEASQAIGALLLFGLVAAPPAAAQLLTNRPWWGFVLSGLLSITAMWTGIIVAYAVPTLPVSFDIMSAATLIYLLAAITTALTRRRRRRTATETATSMPSPSAAAPAASTAATPTVS